MYNIPYRVCLIFKHSQKGYCINQMYNYVLLDMGECVDYGLQDWQSHIDILYYGHGSKLK